MELKTIKKYSVKLPFSQKVNHQSTTHKEGAYLYFSDDLGRELIGDISPFPGFSPYSIDTLIVEFQEEWKKNKLKSSKNPHLEFLEYQLTNYWNFGAIKEYSTKVNTLFRANELKHISSTSQFKNINQEFPICFKIKAQTEKDIENIEHFITSTQNIKNKLSIRIDSNGTWTSKEAIRYFQRLKKAFEVSPLISFDYFEEPLNSKEEYKKLINYDQTLPYTLEESLEEYLLSPTEFSPVGVVIKPSQQGISVLKKLKDKTLRIILSSAFESPVSLKSLYYLSSRLPNEFHGLSARVHEKDFTWS